MIALLDTPLFGIFLSLAAYAFGVFIHKKTGLLILHPLLIALCCVIGFLSLTGVPLSYYEQGGNIISMFLPAATASLALSIYRQGTEKELASRSFGNRYRRAYLHAHDPPFMPSVWPGSASNGFAYAKIRDNAHRRGLV